MQICWCSNIQFADAFASADSSAACSQISSGKKHTPGRMGTPTSENLIKDPIRPYSGSSLVLEFCTDSIANPGARHAGRLTHSATQLPEGSSGSAQCTASKPVASTKSWAAHGQQQSIWAEVWAACRQQQPDCSEGRAACGQQ